MTHTTEGRPRETWEIKPDTRMQAMTEILAVQASWRPDVIRFREEFLRGQLLDPSDVAGWVRDRLDGEGSSMCITVELPPGVRVDLEGDSWRPTLKEHLDETAFIGTAGTILSIPKSREDILNEARDGAAVAQVSVFIRLGGALGRLKALAGSLSSNLGWKEHEAVGFILTGDPPMIPTARTQLFYSPPYKQPARIVMDLSAQTKVEDVKKLFLKMRSQTASGEVARFRRYRQLTSERRALAVFLVKTPDLSWEHRRVEWNLQYPRWSYTDRPNFRRAATGAYLRATGRIWRQAKQ